MNSWESKTTVIIPTYNERDTIPELISDIFRYHPAISVLVVDDNSPDGTAQEVRSIAAENKNVELLERTRKDGLGNAYKAAYALLLSRPHIERIITMDADWSHDPLHLEQMFEVTHEHDLVVGSRYVSQGGISNWTWWRRMMSKWGNIYTRLLCKVGIKDMTAGFICVSTDIARKINIQTIASSGYSYQIEFKYRCTQQNARVKEIPIIFNERRAGVSKMSGKIIREGLLTPLKIYWNRQK